MEDLDVRRRLNYNTACIALTEREVAKLRFRTLLLRDATFLMPELSMLPWTSLYPRALCLAARALTLALSPPPRFRSLPRRAAPAQASHLTASTETRRRVAAVRTTLPACDHHCAASSAAQLSSLLFVADATV